MSHIGTISQLLRYPVKSMGGESIASAQLGLQGIPGDRGWAVRDELAKCIRGAKKFPDLMRCKARYPVEPAAAKAGPAEITFPDGAVAMSDTTDAAERLSQLLAREVTLWPLQPADKLDHYRRGAPDNPDMLQELRAIFGREPDEPLPDLSKFPPELVEFESPPGTYFDAFPLLIMTESSLSTLQNAAPDSLIDIRRFRPNILISTENSGFAENAWVGKTLQIGEVEIAVKMECPRCVMTTHGFDDLPQDAQVMRALVRDADQNLGVYAEVITPGEIKPGDVVSVV